MMRARIVRHSLFFLRRLFGRCSTFWRSTLRHGTRRNITTEPLPHWVLSRSLDNSATLKQRDRKRQVIRPSIRLRETPDADCWYLPDTLVVPMPYAAEPRILESEDATTRETKYELVLKAIAALRLNDETPHIQKLELCVALARAVLDSKGACELFNSAARPAEHTACTVRESSTRPNFP